MVFPCRINGISAGGVSILAPSPPVPGVELVLHVPYLGEFRAEPVHIAGERVGLKLLCDAEAQSELVGQLSALLRSDRRSQAEAGAPRSDIDDPDLVQAATA